MGLGGPEMTPLSVPGAWALLRLRRPVCLRGRWDPGAEKEARACLPPATWVL